jgi:hypothetical protein
MESVAIHLDRNQQVNLREVDRRNRATVGVIDSVIALPSIELIFVKQFPHLPLCVRLGAAARERMKSRECTHMLPALVSKDQR